MTEVEKQNLAAQNEGANIPSEETESPISNIQSIFLQELNHKLATEVGIPETARKILIKGLARLLNETGENNEVIKRRILAKFLDATFVSYIKLPLEAYVGKKIMGNMDLNELERICYAVSGISSICTWALGGKAMITSDPESLKYVGALYATSWVSYLIGMHREIEDTLVRSEEELRKYPELHSTLKQMSDFLQQASLQFQL